MLETNRIRIALDAMGGDEAPFVNVKGAIDALSTDPSLIISLVGIPAVIERELAKLKTSSSTQLEIIPASEVIEMNDHATSVIRKKRDSSIHIGLKMVREGTAHAFVSAGNSGAVMAGALLLLGRIGDVERPAILVKLPTASGTVSVLDVGANVDCRASHLVDFAIMGRAYSHFIDGIRNPSIGLLSNGSEFHKGNELTRKTHDLLINLPDLNYRGYVEGYDIFRGTTDVVVCDGFVGNVVLKSAEGIADAFVQWFRQQLRGNLLGLAGVILLRKVLRDFRKKFDYQPYGAAPLLGINGMVLISHGGSTEVAIRSGILTAKKGVEEKFVEKMIRALSRTKLEETSK